MGDVMSMLGKLKAESAQKYPREPRASGVGEARATCPFGSKRALSGVCSGVAISKKYPEVGAYNSPWIKSYEHRRVNFFFAAY